MALTPVASPVRGAIGTMVTVEVVPQPTGHRYFFAGPDQQQPPNDWNSWSAEPRAEFQVGEAPMNITAWARTENSSASDDLKTTILVEKESAAEPELPDPRLGTVERIYDPIYAAQMRAWILGPAGILAFGIVIALFVGVFVWGTFDELIASKPFLSTLIAVILAATGIGAAGVGSYLMAVEHRATLPRVRRVLTTRGEEEQLGLNELTDPKWAEEFRKMPAPWAVTFVAIAALLAAAWVGGRIVTEGSTPTTPTESPAVDAPAGGDTDAAGSTSDPTAND